jgi:general nucleoside transport system permease protein
MLHPLITTPYWYAALQEAGPLALAALGAVLCARAGILFIGVEGTMLAGSFFSIAGTIWTGSIWAGLVFGAAAGVVTALLFGFLSMSLRMGDIIAGLVIQIGALGVTGFLQQQLFAGGETIGERNLGPLWGATGQPVADIFLHQNILMYVTVAAAVAMQFFFGTKHGLRVRASGESASAAVSVGVSLIALRFAVLAVAGVLTGLGGAVLGLAVVGTFSTNIINGRGFIALACVILGAWRPVPTIVAAGLFAAVDTYSFAVDNATLGDWIQLFPYVITIFAIGALWGRKRGPAEEGRGLPDSS